MDSQGDPSQRSVPGEFKLTAKQAEAERLLQLSRRHTLLVGGARSGKTSLLVRAIAERAVRVAKSRHAILRLRANAARASIAFDTLPKIFALCHPRARLKPHKSDGYFALENGSEIWIGGLDDNERVEKILGKEYVTIFLNECSQIPYASVLIALTRLAQVAGDLHQAAYYDLNPTSKAHWTNILFGEKRDPISRAARRPRQLRAHVPQSARQCGKPVGGLSERPAAAAGAATPALLRRCLCRRC